MDSPGWGGCEPLSHVADYTGAAMALAAGPLMASAIQAQRHGVVLLPTALVVSADQLSVFTEYCRASMAAVATGSYNFTRSARVANAENLLILRGNPALVRAYLGNWRRHKAEAQLLHSLDELPGRKRKEDGREPDRASAD